MVTVRRQPIRGDLKKRKGKRPVTKPDVAYRAYQRWIKSAGFRKLREIMLERDGHKCRFCGRTDDEGYQLQAHHRSYEHVGKGNDEELDDLITLCSCCHRACHSSRQNIGRFRDKTPVLKNLNGNPDMECLLF